MVFFDIDDDRKYELDSYLLEKGVKILPYEGAFRFVTHYDVTREEIKKAVDLVRGYFA
jgi:threonine aldolase